MRKLMFVFLMMVSVSGFAQRFDVPASHPKLVVGIVIDGLPYDLVYKNRDMLQEHGFKKLINQGAYCSNANYEYLFTQRAPGYASLVTGSEPSWHGVVADYWFETLSEGSIHAVQNSEYDPVGTLNRDNACSPDQLMASTFSDAVKMYFQNQSKVYSVSLDATAAVMNGGFKADAAYWLDENSGKFVSSSYYLEELPKWVKKFNKNDYTSVYFDRKWEPLDSLKFYKRTIPDSNRFEYGYDAEFKTFPYLYEDIKGHYTGDKFIKMIPEGNTMTTDFAVATFFNENLGDDLTPDVLMVNYHVSENIGKYFGPDSKEMLDMLLRLDKEVAHLVDVIEDETGKNNTLFFLTSSSGLGSNPEYRESEKLPGGRFKHHYVTALLKSYLNVLYGEGEWIRDYQNQQIFLNRTLIEDADLKLADVQKKVADFILSYDGVAAVLTADDLVSTDYTSGIFKNMQNSFHQKRSGDVLIALKPGWIRDVYYTADHNSCYTYDTHVPLMFYGWKVRKTRVSRPVNITDVVPSICDMMNIPPPGSVSGIPIEEISR